MRTLWRVLLILLIGLSPLDQSFATAPQQESEVVSVADLEARLSVLSEDQQDVKQLYNEAIARIGRATSSQQAAARFRAETAAAPVQLGTIREELLQPVAEPAVNVPDDVTLAELEQGEADAIAALAAARGLESQLQAETTQRQERRVQIQDVLPLRRQELLRVEEALGAPSLEGDSPDQIDARRASLLAERLELVSKIDELEAERASYDARRDLLPARRDRAARRVVEAAALAAAWRQIVSDRRQKEAERSAQEAERLTRQTARQHPVLRAYAAETRRLAEQRTQSNAIPQRIDLASQQVSEARSAFSSLRQRYVAVKQRIDASGLDRATGLMLRREFESLPSLAILERQAAAVSRELEDVEYLLFERRDDRVGSDDINLVRQRLLSDVGDPRDRDDLEVVATELVIARRDVLSELENDADRFQDVLVDLDRESRQLFIATAEYESFIRERILWVRSVSSDQVNVIEDFRAAEQWLVDGRAWAKSLKKLWGDILQRFPAVLVTVACIVLLFIGARWSRGRITATAELVKRYRTDRFGHTMFVLLYTVLAASPPAVTIWWLGWLLARPIDQLPVAVSLGIGLQNAAYVLFVLSLVRQTLRPSGLADCHFRWSDSICIAVRRHLRWYTLLVVPAITLIAAVGTHGDEQIVASLGRVAFSVVMLASAVLIHCLFRPTSPLVFDWLKEHRGGWIDRLKYVLHLALIAIPVGLTILAWLGFYYTAIQLEQRLESTIVLSLLLILANGLLLRWLFLARRRVTVEDARRRREQAITAAESGQAASEDGPTESSLPAIDEDKLDLPSISLQTRQLFRTAVWITAALGVFSIWVDVLPALRMLDSIEVYPNQRVVEATQDDGVAILETGPATRISEGSGRASEANGDSAESPVTTSRIPATTALHDSSDAGDDAEIRVTVADVGVAFVVLLGTFIAFRNLPGLIEIVVLQRLPLDAGSRYALSTVLKYAITVVGVAASFGALSISWSNVQWLAAALTFGLAFGLQEIFANFISGLIILAERPIRIGDTVTVGNVSGTVTRIRMRATLITDWNRKELVIPNKNFITGDVINWTLTDPTLRLDIPVGIGYGEDIRKAEEILIDIASRASNVQSEPKPYVVFGSLGESTLDFQLRVFIPHVDHTITVKTEIHKQIIESFREADIEIAFPQRDLHLRSSDELRGLLARPNEAE